MSAAYKELYEIVGEGFAFTRVKDAMQWLLSEKGENIGGKLLEDAFRRTGKPLIIHASDTTGVGYVPNVHTVFINPSSIAKVSFGAGQPASVEQCLGHEMVHSGQTDMDEAHIKVRDLISQARESYISKFSPQEYEAQIEHIQRAIDAPDYESAMKHVERYVDEHVLPAAAHCDPLVHNHPDYHKYIADYEAPAVAVENRIATLRGDPTRDAYQTKPVMSAEDERRATIN